MNQTNDSNQEMLLSVNDLTTTFSAGKGQVVTVVNDVSFHVAPGEVVAIVGESGSGKSITSLSIMGLLKSGGEISDGTIYYKGEDILPLSKKKRRKLRGKEMAMIFQEPMSSLNPMQRVSKQIEESLALNTDLTRKERQLRAINLLQQVDIPDAEQVASRYPHQLSGGMRQRVMIAIALASSPKLLIADEPTTALDVTIQAQILALIKELNEAQETGVLFITHDLGVVADIADRVLVMYAGRIVEEATVTELFDHPKHPYTLGLLKAVPKLDEQKEWLDVISGNAPDLARLPEGCPFHPRCPKATDACLKLPALEEQRPNHYVRCIHPISEEANNFA
ncbi:ABC transporter ATP-binding protein [Alkalicoccobacillus murimartini]|uniref:Oligopeptide transport system ATP-binding protein n=1 Tax=Alkalicoccobacillus murimartini TaxID=171685 RepID=A0ABT9YMR2_9BACI|nr:ABC transporter ATP-binding protein [Alkalicoccobacillus murimartini]MDQ0209167.1 oligopeptide transport system ATP-binding protein [Alkalicoccobacillus murimartini]